MIERFSGEPGKRMRVAALQDQRVVAGNAALAEELAAICELRQLTEGEILIQQDGADNDLYFILTGRFKVVVNDRKTIGHRIAGEHVGEMAAIEPALRRSASVIATEPSVVAKISEVHLADIGSRYPNIYLCFAKTLAKRLHSRNAFVGARHEKIRVFIISSTESLKIAHEVKAFFDHDTDIFVEIWSEGTFRIAHYTIDDLAQKVEDSDIAVAIAHGDDHATIRHQSWPIPRDNVTFELGLFMGRLGRLRAVLMEPRDDKVKLPSDLAGITTITYKAPGKGETWQASLGTACHRLREHIRQMGINE